MVDIKKIVYLFGAGATQAELTNIAKDPSSEMFLKTRLLMGPMSKRIMKKAVANKNYLKDIEMISPKSGSSDIELLISLIENSKINNWQNKSTLLRKLVKEDIDNVLTKSKKNKFYLHKALLELHQQKEVQDIEELIGLISLNYDNVLDDAFKTINPKKPINYCFSSEQNTGLPLLKLHGSFDWLSSVKIRGRKRVIQIIPVGANKNYLHVPYNFIWNQALDVLARCDILRVIGCSLSPNDIHLVDLLFKAHLEKGRAFEIQLISTDSTGGKIKDNYRFFTEMKKLSEIEPPLIPDVNPPNTFKTWLKYKSLNILKEQGVQRTKYLKKVTI